MSNNWPNVKLGEVVTPVGRSEVPSPGTTYRQIGVKLWGEGAYERETIDGGETKYAHLFRAETDDVIVNKIWARNGSVAVVPPLLAGSYGSGEFPMFAPKRDRLESRWMHWLTKTPDFWAQCDEKSRGTSGKNRIRPEQFLRIEVPLPPLEEQRRVVARIDELAAKIQEARVLRQQVVEETQGLISAAMKTHFDFSGKKTRVADYARLQGGYAFPSTGYDESGTHQVVRIGNVRDGFLDLSRAPVRWTPADDTRVLRYELGPGDLVISMTGTRDKRDYGFIAKVPSDKKLLLNQRVGRFVIRQEVDRDYLFYYLRSPFFRDNLFPSATGTANQANVGNADIESVPFAPPQDLSEQRRIVAYLDDLQKQTDALEALQTETSAELDALVPSILDKAFRGEL
jgi:type I restriction enzyme, S subunit